MSEIEKVTLSASPAIQELRRLEEQAKKTLAAIEKPPKRQKSNQPSPTAEAQAEQRANLARLSNLRAAVAAEIKLKESAFTSMQNLSRGQRKLFSAEITQLKELQRLHKSLERQFANASKRGISLPDPVYDRSIAPKIKKAMKGDYAGLVATTSAMQTDTPFIAKGDIANLLTETKVSPKISKANVAKLQNRIQKFETAITQDLGKLTAGAVAEDELSNFTQKLAHNYAMRDKAYAELGKVEKGLVTKSQNKQKQRHLEIADALKQELKQQTNLESVKTTLQKQLRTQRSSLTKASNKLGKTTNEQDKTSILADIKFRTNTVNNLAKQLDDIELKLTKAAEQVKKRLQRRPLSSRLSDMVTARSESSNYSRALGFGQRLAGGGIADLNSRLGGIDSKLAAATSEEERLRLAQERSGLAAEKTKLVNLQDRFSKELTRLQGTAQVSKIGAASSIRNLTTTIGTAGSAREFGSDLTKLSNEYYKAFSDFKNLAVKDVSKLSKVERKLHDQRLGDLRQQMSQADKLSRESTKNFIRANRDRIMFKEDRGPGPYIPEQFLRGDYPTFGVGSIVRRKADLQNYVGTFQAAIQREENRILPELARRRQSTQGTISDISNKLRAGAGENTFALTQELRKAEGQLAVISRERAESEARIAAAKVTQKRLTQQLVKDEKYLNSFQDKALKNFTNFRQLTLTGAITAGGLTMAILPIVRATIDAEKSMNALNRQVRLNGMFGDTAEKTVSKMDIVRNGLVSIADASVAIRNFMRIGFTFDEAVANTRKITEVALENKQSALSLGEAIRSTTEGFRQENSVLADAGGITENISKIYSKFAVTIGKTAESLNQREKAMAIMKEIDKEAAISAGALETQLSSLSGAVDATTGSWVLLQQTLGKGMKDTILSVLGIVRDLIKAFQEFSRENPEVIAGLSMLSVAVLGVIGVLGSLVVSVTLVKGIFSALMAAVVSVATFFGAGASPFAAAITVFGGLGLAVKAAYHTLSDYAEELKLAGITVNALTKAQKDLNFQLVSDKSTITRVTQEVDAYTKSNNKSVESLEKVQKSLLDLAVVQEDQYLQSIIKARDFGNQVGEVWELIKSKMEGATQAQQAFIREQARAKLLSLEEKRGRTPEENRDIGSKVLTDIRASADPRAKRLREMLIKEGDLGVVKKQDPLGQIISTLGKGFTTSDRREGRTTIQNKSLRQSIAWVFDENKLPDAEFGLVEELISKQLQDFYKTQNLEKARLAAIAAGNFKTVEDPTAKREVEPVLRGGLKSVLARTGHDKKYQLQEMIKLGQSATDQILSARGDSTNPYHKQVVEQKGFTNIETLARDLQAQFKAIQSGEISGLTIDPELQKFIDPEMSAFLTRFAQSADAVSKEAAKATKAKARLVKSAEDFARIRETALLNFNSYAGPNSTEIRNKLQQLPDKSQDPVHQETLKNLLKQKKDLETLEQQAKKVVQDIIKMYSPRALSTMQTVDVLEEEKFYIEQVNSELKQFGDSLPKALAGPATQAIAQFYNKSQEAIRVLEAKKTKIAIANKKLQEASDKESKQLYSLYRSSQDLYNRYKEFFDSQESREDLVARAESLSDNTANPEYVATLFKIRLLDHMEKLRSQEISKTESLYKRTKERNLKSEEAKLAEIVAIKQQISRLEELKKLLANQGVLEGAMVDRINDTQENLTKEAQGIQEALQIELIKEGKLKALETALIRNTGRRRNIVSAMQEAASIVGAADAIASDESMPQESRDAASNISEKGLTQMRSYMDRVLKDQQDRAFGEYGEVDALANFRELLDQNLKAQMESNSISESVYNEYAQRIMDIDEQIFDKKKDIISNTATLMKETFTSGLLEMTNNAKSFSDVLYDTFRSLRDRINKLVIEKAIEKSIVGRLFEGIAGSLSNRMVATGSIGSKGSTTSPALNTRNMPGHPANSSINIVNNFSPSISAIDAQGVADVFQSTAAREAMTKNLVEAQKNQIIPGMGSR